MKTMVIAEQKGGVGKTSSVVHLAVDFLERGLRGAVIDLDTQGNACFTLHDFNSDYPASQRFDQNGDDLRKCFRGQPDGPLIRLTTADAALANREKRSLTDSVVVFKQNITALADSGFDVVLIDTALALGVSLASAPYAADCVVSPIELKAACPQLMISGGTGLRSSITDALASGMPVWKIKKTAARKATLEVRALAARVYEKMEITQ
jgi:chromosome partitioning protein